MKIVLDSNVNVAAYASRGLCESIFELCLSEHELILCEDLLSEIEKNLRIKIKLPSKMVDTIKNFLQEHSIMFDPTPLPKDACRDADDMKVLGLAIASNADYIITGDKDLLILEHCQEIPILSPRAFSDIIHSKQK
jgi:putative PIN family toxin of toxin-antitoxin system